MHGAELSATAGASQNAPEERSCFVQRDIRSEVRGDGTAPSVKGGINAQGAIPFRQSPTAYGQSLGYLVVPAPIRGSVRGLFSYLGPNL